MAAESKTLCQCILKIFCPDPCRIDYDLSAGLDGWCNF